MGIQLVAFFDEAGRFGGIQGKMKLAGLVKMTATQAGSVADSPELLRAFRGAMEQLKSRPQPAPQKNEIIRVVGEVATLRKHIETYLDLMSQRALVLGDTETAVRRVNEAASQALDCERVSVWWVDAEQTKITCADLYQRTSHEHSAGVELTAKDFPPYFEALKTERTIAAHDAHYDPRTSCFSSVYLRPLNISSMLDVPIWANGRMVGVVCHEHVGPSRTWNADEEKFAYLMSSIVAIAIERRAADATAGTRSG